jgi:hypothetical protein
MPLGSKVSMLPRRSLSERSVPLPAFRMQVNPSSRFRSSTPPGRKKRGQA